MIAIELHSQGKTPDEAKDVLRRWASQTRNLSRREERNQIIDFVQWLYRQEEVGTISCRPNRTMAQMGWCVGPACHFREQQRKENNARRKGDFNITLWRSWQRYLVHEYRNGAYIAATYEALRGLWLERVLVDGQPVYAGCRELAKLAGKRVDGRARRRQKRAQRMAALRAVHVLEEVGLIRIESRGEHSAKKGFRRANGYVLLPMPPVPDNPGGDAASDAVDSTH